MEAAIWCLQLKNNAIINEDNILGFPKSYISGSSSSNNQQWFNLILATPLRSGKFFRSQIWVIKREEAVEETSLKLTTLHSL